MMAPEILGYQIGINIVEKKEVMIKTVIYGLWAS